MSTELAVTDVLEPGQLTLSELADLANREAGLTTAAAGRAAQAMGDALEHALLAGSALLRARELVPHGKWTAWVKDNFQYSVKHSQNYMRLATYRDVLPEHGELSLNRALAAVADEPSLPLLGKSPVYNDVVRAEAQQMRERGESYAAIGRRLGVSAMTAAKWVDPERREAAANTMRSQNERIRAARVALREQEREQAIRLAVRKAGAATQEAWAMAERMQDVLGQAHREIDDREARAALSRAGEHYRKMRDEIVRALGVA